jgi:hypothetical protein
LYRGIQVSKDHITSSPEAIARTYLLLLSLLLLLLLLALLFLLRLDTEFASLGLFRRRLHNFLDGLGLLAGENIVVIEVALLGLLVGQVVNRVGILTFDEVVGGLALFIGLLGLVLPQSSHEAANRCLFIVFLSLLGGRSFNGGGGLAEIGLPVLLLSLISLLLGRHVVYSRCSVIRLEWGPENCSAQTELTGYWRCVIRARISENIKRGK